ncbi:hypothetical protein [Tenacibaculum xiamenense]|uniref:hypothetical protein n=1 Tax=Tenacibaculum xiamenense TaxID=1261553 RepID=UPI003895ED60
MKVFKEEQRFTQSWLIILLVISAIVPITIITKELIEKKITTLEYLSIVALIIFSICLIFIFKLRTRIDEIGIHYQFFPFNLKMKTIKWIEISKIHIRKYDAISEYGGWGFKQGALWSKKNGNALNIKGDIGIQLELKNGKKLLLGTQKKTQAESVINNYKHQLTAS